MAQSAVEDGIRILAATPHVRDDYPTSAAEMEAALSELRQAVGEAALELELLPGGELALAHLARLEPAELRRFGLGGSETWLLFEFPYAGWPLGLLQLAVRLAGEGFQLVLAHPERNQEVQTRPERLREFVDVGMLVQLTAASVDGRLGRHARDASFAMLELGLAHLLASDAHAPSIRAIGLSAAVEAVGDPDLTRWLTVDVPAALIASAPLPERPSPRSRGHSRRARRR